jgi:hypothetical protein|tara:strand:- start:1401 stop:1568 length:168 start_codon:yes stop_codon:yes gene_type:complete
MKKVKEVKLGRPVNVNSVRQIRLRELEEKRSNGTLKLGRPKMIKVDKVEEVVSKK